MSFMTAKKKLCTIMYGYVTQNKEENVKIKDLLMNNLVKTLNGALRNSEFILLSTLL